MSECVESFLDICSFCPTDQKFASCSDDGTVRIWDFVRCYEEKILRGKIWRGGTLLPAGTHCGLTLQSMFFALLRLILVWPTVKNNFTEIDYENTFRVVPGTISSERPHFTTVACCSWLRSYDGLWLWRLPHK